MIYTHDLRRSELYIYLFAQDFGDITDLTIYSKLVEPFFFFCQKGSAGWGSSQSSNEDSTGRTNSPLMNVKRGKRPRQELNNGGNSECSVWPNSVLYWSHTQDYKVHYIVPTCGVTCCAVPERSHDRLKGEKVGRFSCKNRSRRIVTPPREGNETWQVFLYFFS